MQQLGLSEKQAAIYIAIIKYGPCSITEISSHAKTKRSTTHDCIEELIGRGIINQTFQGARRRFSAADPQCFLAEQKEREKAIKETLPQLNVFYDKLFQHPTLRYFEGIEAMKKAQMEILESCEKEYFYFGSIKAISSMFGKNFVEYYVNERVKRGIWSNSLRIKSHELDWHFQQDGEKYLRRLRFMKTPLVGDSVNLCITDRKIFITSSSKECYAMVIESPEMVNLLKFIWQNCWDNA